MVRSDIISATKANRLYWLGRYEERVYLTLHLLNKCYDMMIDGHPEEYQTFWQKLDVEGNYKTNDEFTFGMLYDENNISSVISAQRFAMDNAMMLREDIMSETLSYLEMSVALMRKNKKAGKTVMTELQHIIDWSLAFWGSAEQRLQNRKALCIMMIGRNVEYMDFLIRFGYPYHRLHNAYEVLKGYSIELIGALDEVISEKLDQLIDGKSYDPESEECKAKLIKYVNLLVRV